MKIRSEFFAVLATLALLSGAPAVADDDFLARMEHEHAGDSPVPSPATEIEPHGPVISNDVSYAKLDGANVDGYFARPDGDGPFPGVIVIQEWWGLNDNIRWMADRLAGAGYLALAVDLYEGEVATDREGAMRLATAARDQPDRLADNLRQAVDYLKQMGATSVGTVGWCFGGGWSLRAGILMGDEVDATVIYYGRVTADPDELANLTAPVLGLFGEQDGGIPVERVREFEAALEKLGKEASIHVYPNADHAFANPSGTRYNEEAATDAWNKTLVFFGEHLKR
jgi:carboxymethylenebutenolidase